MGVSSRELYNAQRSLAPPAQSSAVHVPYLLIGGRQAYIRPSNSIRQTPESQHDALGELFSHWTGG